MVEELPAAVVNARGVARIRAGHPWVFRPDVIEGPNLDAGDGGPALVSVRDARGKTLGTATWAARPQLALRMVTRGSEPAPARLRDLVEERFHRAIAWRQSLKLDRDAFRLVHGESDGLPGLIIDRYADAAVIQTTSVAMNACRGEIADLVRSRLAARIVIARDDGSARDFEELPRFAGVLAGGGPTRVGYRLGPNQLEADLLADSKTGGFLDQADNHALLAEVAAPILDGPGTRALDAFTAHGGFALALARLGGQVVALDESEAAVERARANAARNHLANLTVERANAFDRLRAFEAAGERFEVVVLDPPALAKRGGGPAALTAAARAYKELVLRGARLVRPGGLLAACSCSGRISRAGWDDICAEGLADAGRSAQVLGRFGAGRDHPELAGVPETGHLKVWLFRML